MSSVLLVNLYFIVKDRHTTYDTIEHTHVEILVSTLEWLV